jgi:hypothetical protein
VNGPTFRKALERGWTKSERVAKSLVQGGYARTYAPNRYRVRTGGKIHTQWVLVLTRLGEATRDAEVQP